MRGAEELGNPQRRASREEAASQHAATMLYHTRVSGCVIRNKWTTNLIALACRHYIEGSFPMRSLLLGAALPALLLTGAFACDFNREAQQDQPTVVAECAGSNCMDPTTSEPSAADKRVDEKPTLQASGNKPDVPHPVQD